VTIDRLAHQAAEAVDEARLIALAHDLIRIRSVYEPMKGNTEREAARFLADYLRKLGLTVHVEEAAPGRPNVIADWQGTGYRAGSKTLMLEGHTDVVTEGDAASWRYPPFAGVIEEGRLYGRGAADMKGGIAAAVCALEAVIQTAPGLGGRIRLGLVADEEGMMLGIKDFIRKGWADEVDGAIICEPEENELCLWQKGAMRVGVLFKGAMAHGAMPYAGVNPIPRLADFVSGVRELEATEQRRLGEHPYLGLPWLTPTVVRAPARGEAQHNVVPETAYLALDVRTVPGQDHQALFAALEDTAAGLEGVHIDLELIEERPWTETPKDDLLVLALERACRNVLKRQPAYGGVPGATDGTFLRAWAGVPIVTVGPGGRTVPHQCDEFVEVSQVLEAARLYAAAAVYFLHEPRPDDSVNSLERKKEDMA
jgi:succinyl-diaminopimelate desuccinylase